VICKVSKVEDLQNDLQMICKASADDPKASNVNDVIGLKTELHGRPQAARVA
jgi:hypothetical protein